VQLGESRAEGDDVRAGRPVGERPGRRPERHGQRAAGQLDAGCERADARCGHDQPGARSAVGAGDRAARAEDGDRERRRRHRPRADDQRRADECDAGTCTRPQLGRDRESNRRRAERADSRSQHSRLPGAETGVEPAGRVGSGRSDSRPASGRAPLDRDGGPGSGGTSAPRAIARRPNTTAAGAILSASACASTCVVAVPVPPSASVTVRPTVKRPARPKRCDTV